MHGVKAALRDARYALPGRLGRLLPAPDAQSVARLARRLEQRGIWVTTGYIPGPDAEPAAVAAKNIAVIALLAGQDGTPYLAAKLPTLAFDEPAFATIAQAADSAAMPLLFDAHALKDAGPIHAYLAALLPERPCTGCVLPARWRRSMDDAARLRDTTARLRIVKGEWADPDWPDCDMDHAYRALVETLAGRSAPVAIATHKPELAEHALRTLRAAGTPCELEQLRGLPMRRTTAIARKLGVPVRVYIPFGEGWWPYALDKALARPYLPLWMLRDLIG
ncbi:proline dehydrogenase [Novosphingobium sp. EMRT-2]|uniref:proline dehydrogenase n=1 Tax=Novosphingobium sp. EMRT-2 TaxID=2571749 RepID=UPI0010BDE91B|nr:proline dehydrogenase [Novosphingobium sp. EMRT-2]QCI93435.1 proline dehydrogenase [Novosphingobium sp. EMRT-2]